MPIRTPIAVPTEVPGQMYVPALGRTFMQVYFQLRTICFSFTKRGTFPQLEGADGPGRPPKHSSFIVIGISAIPEEDYPGELKLFVNRRLYATLDTRIMARWWDLKPTSIDGAYSGETKDTDELWFEAPAQCVVELHVLEKLPMGR